MRVYEYIDRKLRLKKELRLKHHNNMQQIIKKKKYFCRILPILQVHSAT